MTSFAIFSGKRESSHEVQFCVQRPVRTWSGWMWRGRSIISTLSFISLPATAPTVTMAAEVVAGGAAVMTVRRRGPADAMAVAVATVATAGLWGKRGCLRGRDQREITASPGNKGAVWVPPIHHSQFKGSWKLSISGKQSHPNHEAIHRCCPRHFRRGSAR